MSDAAAVAGQSAPRTAIVAGGSGGIGAAICRTLAAAGLDVALTYNRNRDRAEKAADAVRALGRRAEIAPVDLNDEAVVRRFVDGAAESFGGIRTAVYAAGPYINMRHISRLEPGLFRETLGTDIFGCYNFLHAALPHLRQSCGVVAALATPAIRRYAVKDVLSAAPKAAIEAVVKGIAAEEGRFGIRANCIGVGVIEDGMYHQLLETGDFDQRFLDTTRSTVALRRLGSAQDIADAVAFLVSDKAGYITGQTLMVDGGYAM
jgi:NAD(P)-dependent dehydrogenase (short-subunit alcohol dehydrogenase family)